MNKGIDRRLLLLAGTAAAAATAWRLTVGKSTKPRVSSTTSAVGNTTATSSTGSASPSPAPAVSGASSAATLGINLTPISYWNPVAFIDRLKASSPWDTHGIVAPVNALGYPTGMGGQPLISTMMPCEPGTYLLSHDGDMDVRVQGGTLVSGSGGSVVYSVTTAAPTGRALIIDAIRRAPTFMRFINQKDATAFTAGEIFAPEFLSQIKGFNTLRFMDWMRTNGSSVTDTFPSAGSCSYANGVPIEIMLALAKKIGARPWLCVPHLATDALVTQMITAMRQSAAAGSPSGYLEYSNEVWNLGFQQGLYAQRQAAALWGAATPSGTFYGYRAAQIARLARASGVRVVIGAQTMTPERAAPVWDGVSRAGGANGDFAGWIIATYVTGTLTDASGPTLALASANDINQAIDNLLHATGTGAMSVDIMRTIYAKHGDIARAHGLPLIAYEGNLHLNPIPTFATQQALVVPFFTAITKAPASVTVMQANLAAFAAAGGSVACLYNLSSGPSNGGYFGLVDSGSWSFITQVRTSQSPAT